MDTKYKWKINMQKYNKGTFLLGLNFNTNDEYGKDERETYICIYLGKFMIIFGKYH